MGNMKGLIHKIGYLSTELSRKNEKISQLIKSEDMLTAMG